MWTTASKTLAPRSACSSGGFIGELGTSKDPDDTYIDNCFFDGRLEATHSNSWGGFIGWVEDEPDAYITNCLFSPAYVGVNDEGNKTFARGSDIHLTNCYYKHLLTDAQGATKARDMDNETLRMKLGEAWEVYAGRVLPIMTPRSLTGEGTEQSPYRIATFDDWHRLATNVYLGESYKDKYFLMTNDISTSRLVGAQPSTDIFNAFSGIFDGDGHTLTLNYTTDAEFCGPFCYTYGATIRNLITSGTINTSQKHAGGVVGRNGTSLLKLSNVTSSMTINSSFRGSAEHGGLVGYAISADIIGSAFTGSLLGEKSTGCAGLVGWKTNTDDSSVSITDCLFAPSSVTVGTANAYTQPLGTAQGKRARSIIAEQYVTMQNAGTATEYNVSGITSYDVGIRYNDVLYAGVGDAVSLNLGYAFTEGIEADGFSVSAGTLEGDVNPYILTMHDKDVLVSANIAVTPWEGDGTEASPFLISYPSQWELLADRVAVGTDYTAVSDASFSIPNARLVGSKTFEFTEVSMYAPKNLTSTATCTTATVSWTGAAESYKVRYRPTTLNTAYFFGFEEGLPDGWTTIDADSDGNCWDKTDNIPDYAHGGTAFMSSASYHNDKGVLTPDNWLVSPRLPLNGVLKVWMKGQDPNDFQEHVAIYVSTTGNTVADFTDIVLPETVVTNEYVTYTVNLSKYGGEQGYIAIRHFNCTDQYRLDVDDFGLYDANSPSDAWQEVEVTGTTAVITDLQPGTYYAYQVVGIVDEDSYPSAVAVLQTDEEEPQVNHVSVTPGTTSAKVNWEGYGRSYNVRYAIDMATENTAKVTLTVGDVWEDHSGYQMLLDAHANTFGRIIPTIGPLTDPGSASAEDYAEFEYKIPEYADGELTTHNIILNNSVTIDIPAGTYDWCITNPSPELEMIFIASAHGNIGGRKDNYVFEAGKHYEFTVSLDGDYDRVDLVTTPMYGEWNQQTVESGELTALLSGLTRGTRYVVQVQAVLDNGKTSEWSPVEQFTTLDDGAIVLNDDLDNSTVIEDAAASDLLYDVTLADRTLYKDGSWNTLCLPFDASIDDAPLVGATVMELDTDEQNGFDPTDGTLYLTFKPATAIKAGVPYLVKWTSGTDINNPVFDGVTISSTGAQPVVSAISTLETVQMVGTYSPVSVMADDKSILYLESDNTLCYPAVDLQILSCRAYFSVPYIQEHAEAQARAFVLSFDGEETGIETISTPSNPSTPSNSSNHSTPYFSLDGRRLDKPSSPGLYIHNGRKVLIK
jgi:hypothetical protein